MSIGENIRTKRESLGMSRGELVERSGVSPAQLSRIERDEQKNPNLETLVAIATALNASLDEIVFGDEETSSLYLSKAIENLPEKKREFVRELVKMTVMISSSEEMDKGMKKA
ncbi:helix-turn-helix transcriptional regulator [Shewanella algae]|uniref:helix-turn-helix domain-containing protein n=1 Tax=Shewanella algae TaxID=38313 RepID=UPI0031F498AC